MKSVRNTTILQFALGFIFMIGWFIIFVANGRSDRQQPNYIPHPTGNEILIIRLPIPPSPQQDIIIYNNGIVSQGAIEELYSGKSSRHYELPKETLERIQGIQNEWCKSVPPVLTPLQDTPTYGIGISCEGRNAIQMRLPFEQLPKALLPLVIQAYP